MSLSEFIRHHHREIIDRFEAFARTLGPVTADLSAVQLRDHAEEAARSRYCGSSTPAID